MSSSTAPTNDAVDWKAIASASRRQLIWKESRLLLPACVGLVALAILGMIAWGLFPANNLRDNVTVFIALALGGGAMAGLVCGAMAFCPERETGTDTFLARLPLSGSLVVRTKVIVAFCYLTVSYLVSILAALVLFAVFFNGTNLVSTALAEKSLGEFWPVAIAVPFVIFLWSLAFSKHSTNTLNTVLLAACFAILVPTFGFGLIALVWDWAGLDNSWQPYLFGSLFTVQVLVLIAVNVWGCESWLRPTVKAEAAATNDSTELISKIGSTASFAKSFNALAWQTYRLHRYGWLIAAFLCFLYLTVSLAIIQFSSMAVGTEATCFGFEYANDLFAAALGGITGIFLFSKDQSKHSYRFFQQRADYPRRVWFARLLGMVAVGAMVTLVAAIINNISFAAVSSQQQTFRMGSNFGAFSAPDDYWNSQFYLDAGSSDGYFIWLTYRTVMMFFAVAVVGKLVSIFCRHGILAALLGIASCSLTAVWVRYINWYQVPTWAYVWPIIFAACLLTWAYAPSWIRGTRQWTWATLSSIVMFAVFVAMVVALRADRLNDFRRQPLAAEMESLFTEPERLKNNGDPRFEVARKIEASQSKIAAALAEIRDSDDQKTTIAVTNEEPVYTDEERELVKSLDSDFETIVELAKDPKSRYLFYQSPDASEKAKAAKERGVADTLSLYLDANRSNGIKQFDALLAKHVLESHGGYYWNQFYLQALIDWAESDARTDEEIKYGISGILDLIAASNSDKALAEFELNHRGVLNNERQILNDPFRFRDNFDLPWEIERTKRVRENNLINKFQWEYSARKNSVFLSPFVLSLSGAGQLTYKRPNTRPMRDSFSSWKNNKNWTFLNPNGIRNDYLLVRMALAAWKLEHGEYPETLQVATDKYLGGQLEPWRLENYSFYPNGLDLPVVLKNKFNELRYRLRYGDGLRNTVEETIPRNKPFILPWISAPTEKGLFVVETKNENNEVVSKTAPAMGYFMGPHPSRNLGWYNSDSVKLFQLDRKSNGDKE